MILFGVLVGIILIFMFWNAPRTTDQHFEEILDLEDDLGISDEGEW